MHNNITTDKLRVLIIDDNTEIHKDFRKSLEPFVSDQSKKLSDLDKKLFEKEGTVETEKPTYELSFASQGQQGLECIKKALEEHRPFALAFVDIRMPPGWDGIETIQGIWKIDPWIQIVICTAYSDYSWSETIKKTGGTDNLMIIKKPFDIVEIQQVTYALTKKWKMSQEIKAHVLNLEKTIKERTRDLEKSVALIRATLESTGDGIFVVDIDGNIINNNEKFFQLWNIPEHVAKKNNEKDFIEHMQTQLEDPKLFLSKIKWLKVNKEEESFDELIFLNKSYIERYSKPYIENGKIIGRIWSYRDITWRKNLQQELLFQATHDKLTNLPNKRLLDDRIRQQIVFSKRKKEKFAILYLDLDNFKAINDSMGHSAGDFVLILITKRITSIVREMDTVARLGGDEFAIIIPEIKGHDEVEILANKILNEARKPFFINKNEFVVTISMGIVFYPNDGDSSEELLKKADSAMYGAKKQNKNSYKFYDVDMTVQAAKSLRLENDLRQALVNQEFELHYQPLVDVFKKKIIGVEALIRWRHPTLGLLMPNDFIKAAEESGLMVAIGEWVIRTACQQNKNWQKQNIYPIKVAVNISSTQFKSPGFESFVENILNETGLDPQYLELELTESIIIEYPELMLDILHKISALGIGLIIDDFGTGYSSLRYLKRYPFTKLKIDQSFVKDIEKNENDYKLVQAIVGISENLKLDVIADGIETQQQLLQVTNAKCNEAQGYFISRPLDSQNATNFLRTYDFSNLQKFEQGKEQ